MPGPAEKFLTRHQVVDVLNAHGFPMTFSTLSKLCMPSRNEGLPCVGRWRTVRAARVGSVPFPLHRARGVHGD